MEYLFKKAIFFAQSSVTISTKFFDNIFYSRQSLLYHNDDPSIKKDLSVKLKLQWAVVTTPRFAK